MFLLEQITIRIIVVTVAAIVSPFLIYTLKKLGDYLGVMEYTGSEDIVLKYIDLGIDILKDQKGEATEEPVTQWVLSHAPKAVKKAELNVEDVRSLVRRKL